MKKGIIIFLVAVIVILGGYIIYDKLIKEDAPIVEDGNQQKDNIQNKEEVSVVTSVDKIKEFNFKGCNGDESLNKKLSVRLPHINGNTSTINSINQKIESKYSSEINQVNNGVTKNYAGDVTIDYQYKIENDILTINISYIHLSECNSGDEITDSIYYDIKNDK